MVNAKARPTTLYLVRHGETDYNRLGMVQGRRIDSVLNERGREQAAALARRLEGIALDAICTSPLKRAVETASYVSQSHPEIPIYEMPDLEEMSWGVFEGKALTPDVIAAFAEMRSQWDAGIFEVPVEGGESIKDVQRRALRVLSEIETKHKGETILVVTHGRFLRVLLSSILPGYGLDRMHEIAHTNTAVNLIRITSPGIYEAERLNCLDHLAGAEFLTY